MDLCLIQTPAPELKQDRLQPQMGQLYIATFLRQYGFDVGIADLSSKLESQWEIPKAENYGFTTYSTTYHRTKEIKKICCRINPYARTIAGGVHASALPEEVAADFNYVVVGEGEIACLRILDGVFDVPIIKGVPIADLDSLPFPDYSLIDLDSYERIVGGMPSISLLSSRGCPYKCIFCNSITMGKGVKLRFRSPENVVAEIAFHRERGRRAFRFEDDLFALNLSWLQVFTTLVKEYDIVYRAFLRGDTLAKPGVAELLYEGGCRHVAIGIETGSDMLLDAMNKGETVAQIKEGIKRAKGAGLIVRGYFIVGFPGETWSTIEETIQLVRSTPIDEFSVYPLLVYPGTELWKNPEKYGITIVDDDLSHYFQVCGDQESFITYITKELDLTTLWQMYLHLKKEIGKIASWSGTTGEFK